MTEPFDEYGERLRRVLHAEAETVTPSPEGLEQIRTKIAERADRRLTTWLTAPWIRPLLAVAAAVCITVVAVSAAPALKTFVQTGHFNSDVQHDGGQTSVDGRYTGGTETSPGSGRTGTEMLPHPIITSSATPGSHGTGHRCTSTKRPADRSGTSAQASATPTPHRTCSLEPTVPTSPTEVATPPQTSEPTQPPATNPATDGGGGGGGPQPSAQSSP